MRSEQTLETPGKQEEATGAAEARNPVPPEGSATPDTPPPLVDDATPTPGAFDGRAPHDAEGQTRLEPTPGAVDEPTAESTGTPLPVSDGAHEGEVNDPETTGGTPETSPLPDGPRATRPANHADEGKTFEQLGIPEDILKGLASLGYATPTDVQAAIYQKAVDNRDLLVRSKTGTGKTAAFMLPVLARIPSGTRRTKALVLVPTRELAIQVAEEGAALAAYRDIAIEPIYGGVGLGQQAERLRSGAAVVVGTPGRTLDHIRRKNLDLGETTFVVLDEADEMLSVGFLEEVTAILKHVQKAHQTLLLSATVSSSVATIISSFMRDPEEIFLSTDIRSAEGIKHILFECSDAYPKARSLLYALYMENPESAIVFCNTRDDCAFVSAYLRRQGFDAEFINSDLSQTERMRVMRRVKRGELSLLVATDIAARGIDISDLTHVINYSLPDDPDLYLHRVGRTGRIGKLGTAITLVSGRDLTAELALERRYHIPFERKTLPPPEEAVQLWSKRHIERLQEAADRLAYETYIPMVRHMLTELPEDQSTRLFAAALRVFFSWNREQGRRDTDAHAGQEGRRDEDRGPRGRKPGDRIGARKPGGRRGESPREDRTRGTRGRQRGQRSRTDTHPRATSAPPNRRGRATPARVPPESGTTPPTDVLDPLAAFAAANDIELSAWIESSDKPAAPADDSPKSQPPSGRKRRRGGRKRKRRQPAETRDTTAASQETQATEGKTAGDSPAPPPAQPPAPETRSGRDSSGNTTE